MSVSLFLQLLVVLRGGSTVCLRWTCCCYCIGESVQHTICLDKIPLTFPLTITLLNSTNILCYVSLRGKSFKAAAADLWGFLFSLQRAHVSIDTQGCLWQIDKTLWSLIFKMSLQKISNIFQQTRASWCTTHACSKFQPSSLTLMCTFKAWVGVI